MNLSSIRRFRWQGAILSLLLTAILVLTGSQKMGAQTTATLSGTIQDSSGNVIAGAQVKLTNEATKQSHSLKTNSVGLYVFPSIEPGTYSLEATSKGFAPKKITGIELHTGDQRTIPSFALAVGSESQTVTVEADENLIPVESGERSAVLDSQEINNLALEGRDTTELLKVLPGATSASSGLSNGPSFSDMSITVQQSAVGMGVDINGAVNRGGTALLSDGASILDPGDMASSLSIVDPNFTQEVTVQASNFSADIANGPVVVSAISKSGSERLHGEAYFDARNNVLNANDWQDNHNGNSQGAASYYYPGGDIGGPVPFTHKSVFFWGGGELWRQNLGNSNVLHSYIPSPEMMQGDFSSDNADNQLLCPTGFSSAIKGTWCNDITSGMVLPDGSAPLAVAGATGGKIPSQFLDPGGAALAKIWPKANVAPSSNAQGYNYYAPVPGLNNGWVYRVRGDYNFRENTKLYITYQQAHNSELASGTGAHLYWTPGTAIPYPGGGEQQTFDGKVIAGHLVHTFTSTATNDLMAAWSYGSFPFVEPDPSAALRTTLNYPVAYGSVFGAALNIPAYSGGTDTFPDFSQNSIFDDPKGMYAVHKAAPQFSDTFTKIWGTHTVKMGGYSQNTDNYQSTFSTYQDGNVGGFGGTTGQNPNILTGAPMGSLLNPTANLATGITSSYSENNSSPLADTAQQTTSFFVDDTWKASKHLTVEVGARVEHVGHWYDRQGTGMAVFEPSLVKADYAAGKYAPGFRWHGMDSTVPLSGQPNRLAFISPRFGASYDVFGNGNTVIRGGFGTYRFVTQVNDIAPPLTTAQHVLGYSLSGGHSVMLSQIGSLTAPSTVCNNGCTNGGQTGFDPNDYTQPKTYAYNFTIDQKLRFHTQFEIAYVGSRTNELPDASEGIEGSVFSAVADQNKTPLGALFLKDPVTGVLSTNPEKVGTNLDGSATGNKLADYHPLGYAYGTNTVEMIQGIATTNYNGLQAVLTKTSGKLTFNINGTWSKALGTGLQENPYSINGNYGPTAIDRTYVFNSSYTYNVGKLHTGNQVVNYLAGGWAISGISTWQAGGYIPALLGNGVPNFGLSESYINVPAALSNTKAANGPTPGVTTGIGSATYFGTDANLPIMPVLTCDPRKGVHGMQRLNQGCFSAPAVGNQGGMAYPYMRMGAYFDNDLAIFKSFTIYHEQKVQIRMSAFNWLNHPLPQYSSQNQVNLWYNVDYNSKAITLNQCGTAGCSGATQPSYNYGVMDTKTAAPYQRIITLNVKYSF